MITFSEVFYRNQEALKNSIRYIINSGGSSSTKTYSILQLLVLFSQKHAEQIDILGLSIPHLKSGVLTDMEKICKQFGFNFDDYYQKTDKIFKKGKGEIRFLSIDKLGKAHGGRRDILYINEANHHNFKIVEQLMMRTRKQIFIDFNPTKKFWVHSELLGKDDAILLKSTYKDNPFLDQPTIDFIEGKKGDNNFWRVYGLGEIGVAEGLVFNNFEEKEFNKEQFEHYRHGIDWGFSKDPFAYVRCAIQREELYICDEVYKRGLLNKEAAELIKPIAKTDFITCDSAEPKSISEMTNYGLYTRPAKKGQGSVETGIKFLQSFKKIYIHPDCKNVLDEFNNYDYKIDKNGDILSEPVDAFNHCLVAGTLIETKKGFKKIENIKIGDEVFTRAGYKKVIWSGVSDFNRTVYKVITDRGNYIIGTNNHKVLTKKGFCDIDSLRYNDELLIRKSKCQKVLQYTVKSGQGILNQSIGVIENIIEVVLNIYITLFGKNLKVKEKKGLLFIIKTAIRKIITLKILKKLLQKSITPDTRSQKNEGKNIKHYLIILDILQKSGTRAKKAMNGISNTLKTTILESGIFKKQSVFVVQKYLNLRLIIISFVQIIVKVNIEDKTELMKLLQLASNVKLSLKQINILSKDFVVGRVLTVQEIGLESKVYDLTIEEQHEFFANGILVHNCIDAIRYSLELDFPYMFQPPVEIEEREYYGEYGWQQ